VIKTILSTLALGICAVLSAPAQTEKPVPHLEWVCLEPTVAVYSMPEHRLNFVTVASGSECRIAVPLSAGERVEITSDSLDARNRLESVFGSIDTAKLVEQSRKNNGESFTEFPHNDFYTTLIQQFNYSPDSARARFCAQFPRAYVPLIDWRGLTEPKPCSAKSPTM
jgi:hypothetical protein